MSVYAKAEPHKGPGEGAAEKPQSCTRLCPGALWASLVALHMAAHTMGSAVPREPGKKWAQGSQDRLCIMNTRSEAASYPAAHCHGALPKPALVLSMQRISSVRELRCSAS